MTPTSARPHRYLLTLLWCFPAAVISWAAVLFCWFFWGTKLHVCEGLWCELKRGSWPTRTWYKRWLGTSSVCGGILSPGRSGEIGAIDTKVEIHEHIHAEQMEAAQLASFIWALSIVAMDMSWTGIIHGLIVWTTGAAVVYLSSSLQAWIRGENRYLGNHLEEAAYGLAQEDDAI